MAQASALAPRQNHMVSGASFCIDLFVGSAQAAMFAVVLLTLVHRVRSDQNLHKLSRGAKTDRGTLRNLCTDAFGILVG